MKKERKEKLQIEKRNLTLNLGNNLLTLAISVQTKNLVLLRDPTQSTLPWEMREMTSSMLCLGNGPSNPFIKGIIGSIVMRRLIK
jgi:hypothetical protein